MSKNSKNSNVKQDLVSEQPKKKSSFWKWFLIGAIVFIIFIACIIISLIVSIASTLSPLSYNSHYDTDFSGNVAIIPIKGVIMSEDSGGLFSSDSAVSSEIVEMIEDARDDDSVKAIILEINSPGGSPVATEEIANAVKASGKYTVAWIRETGASGAYWVASSSDLIVANRMSIVGSIGVIASYLEFSGLMERYGVGYERYVSGDRKDMGSPFKESTEIEKEVFQKKLDTIHGFFIDEVAKNRGLSPEQARSVATGEFFVGAEAKELGLVDVLGGRQEAVDAIELELNITASTFEYVKPSGLLDILSSMANSASFHVGEGIGSGIVKSNIEQEKQGVSLRT